MKNYALEISYDGGAFKGWQSQNGGTGVQDALEAAFSNLGEQTRVHGAGRTDVGVHARAQIATAFLAKKWEPRRLVLALNTKLPPSVSVMRAALVPDDFHARYSAVSESIDISYGTLQRVIHIYARMSSGVPEAIMTGALLPRAQSSLSENMTLGLTAGRRTVPM